VTADREFALAREEIGFLTIDHPIVTGAIDSLLGSSQGNSSAAAWDHPDAPEYLLEALFVLETIAPPRLHSDRFLPPAPLRIAVDAEGQDRTGDFPSDLLAERLKTFPVHHLLHACDGAEDLISSMVERSKSFAERDAAVRRAAAIAAMEKDLGEELRRLEALKAVNPSVRPEELRRSREEMEELRGHIASAPVRLDGIRLIWKRPAPRRTREQGITNDQ
jgi:ATP-dependent helicase HepA